MKRPLRALLLRTFAAAALAGLTVAIVTLSARVAEAAIALAGDVIGVQIEAGAVGLTLSGGGVARVEVWAPDIVRMRIARAGEFSTLRSGAMQAYPDSSSAVIYDALDAVYVVTPALSVVILKRPFQVVSFRSDGSLIYADLPGGVAWDTASGLLLSCRFALPGEHYFGLGERGGPIDRRGRRFAMRNVDWGAYGEFSDPLYISIPFYYGLHEGRAHGVFLDNPATPFFDFDADGYGVVTLGVLAGDLDYYVLAGPSPREVAQAYARLTGPSALPPKWTLGYHQSRYSYMSQAELLDVAATLRALQVPADVLYLDVDYMDRLRMFTWNPVTFPAPQEMIASLRAMGFRLVNIFEPVVRTDDPLWAWFSGSGHFLTDGAGASLVNEIWCGRVSWIDFTNPRTRDFLLGALPLFLQQGIGGMWNDLNEPAQNFMSEAIYDYEGQHRTDLEARNVYALHEAAVSYDAQLAALPDRRPWILSRSGYSGIQRYASNWAGDALSSWDSLRVSMQMSLSMGLSGQNQFGHDIGGFLGSPSPELFLRWLECASFTPLFRNHAMNTSERREPWAFGEPWLSLARDVISERYRLLPYYYSVMEEGSRTGAPVIAPTMFHFPADPGTYTQDDAFMVGPSLLVAPIVQEGATTRDVYLPSEATWIDTRDGSTYTGGRTIVLQAPLGSPIVLARGGAIIPRGPLSQHTGTAASTLDIDVYSGPDSAFVLYEDDGETLAYRRGELLRTRIARITGGNLVIASLTREAGTWAPPAGRSWLFRFHQQPGAPIRVWVGSRQLDMAASEQALNGVEGWWHRVDGITLVRINDDPTGITLVVER